MSNSVYLDDRLFCPFHSTPMWYLPLSDVHVCQDTTCIFAEGYEKKVATIWVDSSWAL